MQDLLKVLFAVSILLAVVLSACDVHYVAPQPTHQGAVILSLPLQTQCIYFWSGPELAEQFGPQLLVATPWGKLMVPDRNHPGYE
jgi:hypothetical protein